MGEILKVVACSAIGWRKYRIPSALRSQAPYRDGSTIVGDHMGIRRAELLPLIAVILRLCTNVCEAIGPAPINWATLPYSEISKINEAVSLQHT